MLVGSAKKARYDEIETRAVVRKDKPRDITSLLGDLTLYLSGFLGAYDVGSLGCVNRTWYTEICIKERKTPLIDVRITLIVFCRFKDTKHNPLDNLKIKMLENTYRGEISRAFIRHFVLSDLLASICSVEEEWHYRSFFERLPCLHTLMLRWPFKALGPQEINMITPLSSLRVLKLDTRISISDNGIAQLTENARALISLTLNVDGASAEGIKHLTRLTTLQKLDVDSETLMTNENFEVLTLMKLRVFRVGKCHKITGVGFNALEKMTTLQKIKLNDCPMFTISNLVRLNLTSMRSIYLTAASISDIALNYIGEHARELEKLFLENCQNITTLKGIRGCSKLRVLSVNRCFSLKDGSVVKCFSMLSTLKIENTAITDKDLSALNLTRLQNSDLFSCSELTQAAIYSSEQLNFNELIAGQEISEF